MASEDELIFTKSVNHAHRAIDLAEKLGSKFYSFYAGFLMDPDVNDLGKQFTKGKLKKESAIEVFVDRVNRFRVMLKKKEL